MKIFDKLSDFGGKLSGAFMIAGLVMIVIEILLRSLFHGTLYIAEEYTGYLMSALTFIAYGYTLKEKGHIRMTLVRQSLSPKTKIIVDIFCYIIGLGFSVILLYVTFGYFWSSVLSGTRSMQVSRTYLAIPQFFMPFGSMLLLLQFIAELVKSYRVLRSGSYSDIREESMELGR